MDHGQDRLGAERGQQMSLIYAVMVCLGMLILFQTLLFNIAVEGYLGGVGKVVFPAAAGSGLCFAVSCWLIAYVHRMRK